IDSFPVVSLSSSCPPVRWIVRGGPNPLVWKTIVSSPPAALAWAIACLRSRCPATGVSVKLSTTIVDGTSRLSRASTAGRTRGQAGRAGEPGRGWKSGGIQLFSSRGIHLKKREKLPDARVVFGRIRRRAKREPRRGLPRDGPLQRAPDRGGIVESPAVLA